MRKAHEALQRTGLEEDLSSWTIVEAIPGLDAVASKVVRNVSVVTKIVMRLIVGGKRGKLMEVSLE